MTRWPTSADGFARPPAARQDVEVRRIGTRRSESHARPAAAIVAEAVASARVVIFAKTFCPFCKEVIGLFSTPPYSTVPYRIVQLDRRADGDAIQDHLLELTGARSVPCVFVAGGHLGGCDQTKAAHASGLLTHRLFGTSAIGRQNRIFGSLGRTRQRIWPYSALLVMALVWLWRRGVPRQARA